MSQDDTEELDVESLETERFSSQDQNRVTEEIIGYTPLHTPITDNDGRITNSRRINSPVESVITPRNVFSLFSTPDLVEPCTPDLETSLATTPAFENVDQSRDPYGVNRALENGSNVFTFDHPSNASQKSFGAKSLGDLRSVNPLRNDHMSHSNFKQASLPSVREEREGISVLYRSKSTRKRWNKTISGLFGPPKIFQNISENSDSVDERTNSRQKELTPIS